MTMQILRLGSLAVSVMLACSMACHAEDEAVSKQYDVSALLSGEGGCNQLKTIILTFVEPVSWEDVGGDATLSFKATISFRNDKMLVLQTSEAHKQIEDLIQTLRRCPRVGKRPPKNMPSSMKLKSLSSQDQGPLEVIVYPLADILASERTTADRLGTKLVKHTGGANEWHPIGENFFVFVPGRPALITAAFPETQRKIQMILRDLRDSE